MTTPPSCAATISQLASLAEPIGTTTAPLGSTAIRLSAVARGSRRRLRPWAITR
jgi:hypothetical protein